MQTSHQPRSEHPIKSTTCWPIDFAARKAGLLLLLSAVTSIVAVVARLSADVDQPTLAESLVAISESVGFYSVGGAARLISGVTLVAGAWLLLRTRMIREQRNIPLVPALFAASGVLTALSGACAIALAISAPDTSDGAVVSAANETISYLRWLTGKIGFTTAGLALVVVAQCQWKAGGTLRYISPVSVVIGIAMQFIWFDAATILHPISGAAFFVWLVTAGIMLLTGRVERAFHRDD